MAGLAFAAERQGIVPSATQVLSFKVAPTAESRAIVGDMTRGYDAVVADHQHGAASRYGLTANGRVVIKPDGPGWGRAAGPGRRKIELECGFMRITVRFKGSLGGQSHKMLLTYLFYIDLLRYSHRESTRRNPQLARQISTKLS
jgi:hypothetical protein